MLAATSVFISEQYLRQYRRPCRRCIGGIWEPGLTCAQTWGGMQTYLIPLATQRRPPHAHTSHGTHHTEAIWVSWSTKIKNNNNLQESESGRMYTVHSPVFFRKIVDIERFALRATILDKCQIYLGGGGQFGRRSPSLASFHLLL